MTKIAKVRVTREKKVCIVEYVDLDISQEDDDYQSANTRAEALVKAQVAAGQPIAWVRVSEVLENYPTPLIDAEILAVEPPEVLF